MSTSREIVSSLLKIADKFPGSEERGYKTGARVTLVEAVDPGNLLMLAEAENLAHGEWRFPAYRTGSSIGILLGDAYKLGVTKPIEVNE